MFPYCRQLLHLLLLGVGLELAPGRSFAVETGPRELFSFVRQEDGQRMQDGGDREQVLAELNSTENATAIPVEAEPAVAPLPAPLRQFDPIVQPVVHAEPAAADPRRLGPPSRSMDASATTKPPAKRASPFSIQLPQLESLGTIGAGLALVIGLLLLCVSLLRRRGPNPMAPLPRDAVALLGRVPLSPRQFAHLLQVGNKLVLLAISPDRVDTITEVTDPADVERLLTLCAKSNKQSSSAEFQRMLAQLSKEPARGFLGNEATASYSRPTRG